MGDVIVDLGQFSLRLSSRRMQTALTMSCRPPSSPLWRRAAHRQCCPSSLQMFKTLRPPMRLRAAFAWTPSVEMRMRFAVGMSSMHSAFSAGWDGARHALSAGRALEATANCICGGVARMATA